MQNNKEKPASEALRSRKACPLSMGHGACPRAISGKMHELAQTEAASHLSSHVWRLLLMRPAMRTGMAQPLGPHHPHRPSPGSVQFLAGFVTLHRSVKWVFAPMVAVGSTAAPCDTPESPSALAAAPDQGSTELSNQVKHAKPPESRCCALMRPKLFCLSHLRCPAEVYHAKVDE